MKTKKNKPGGKQPHKPIPRLGWQTGDYARTQTFTFWLPYQFLLLCKLADVTPAKLLTDFMDNLAFDSWKREGREKTREHLLNYFIAGHYGQQYYQEEDIRELFKELDAIGMLWPLNAKPKLMEIHTKWRNKYQHYWFKKWFRKNQRKL